MDNGSATGRWSIHSPCPHLVSKHGLRHQCLGVALQVHQTHNGVQAQRGPQVLALQDVDEPGWVAQAAGFDDQAVRLDVADDLCQGCRQDALRAGEVLGGFKIAGATLPLVAMTPGSCHAPPPLKAQATHRGHAAHAAPRQLAHGDVGVRIQSRRINSDRAPFIDNHGPHLLWRLAGQPVQDATGFPRVQSTRDDVSGDREAKLP